MSYSPQLSKSATVSVRRLAWAMDLKMTETVKIMAKLLPYQFSRSKVCLACQDKKGCDFCFFFLKNPQQEKDFFSQFSEKEQAALEAVM
jgi:hypothetical protein